MKKIIFVSVLSFAVLAGFGIYFAGHNGQTASAQTSTSTADMIHVTYPIANALVTSPIHVTGEARGGWYFEGTAPVKVLNASGTVIGQGTIQAQGAWTTNNFVPFTGNITYASPGTATGTVVFMNDNPSGATSTAMQLSVPVRFSTTTLPGTPNTGGRMFWWLNLHWL